MSCLCPLSLPPYFSYLISTLFTVTVKRVTVTRNNSIGLLESVALIDDLIVSIFPVFLNADTSCKRRSLHGMYTVSQKKTVPVLLFE